MVPQSKQRAFLCWWEAFAPCLGQLLHLSMLSWSIDLVWNICTETSSCCCFSWLETHAWSRWRKHSCGANPSPSPPALAGAARSLPYESSTLVWLPHQAAVSAAGADGVGAAYSLAPALPALMVCLMVEPSPGWCWHSLTAAMNREGWLESFPELAGRWRQRPGRAGCHLRLPLSALLGELVVRGCLGCLQPEALMPAVLLMDSRAVHCAAVRRQGVLLCKSVALVIRKTTWPMLCFSGCLRINRGPILPPPCADTHLILTCRPKLRQMHLFFAGVFYHMINGPFKRFRSQLWWIWQICLSLHFSEPGPGKSGD